MNGFIDRARFLYNDEETKIMFMEMERGQNHEKNDHTTIHPAVAGNRNGRHLRFEP